MITLFNHKESINATLFFFLIILNKKKTFTIHNSQTVIYCFFTVDIEWIKKNGEEKPHNMVNSQAKQKKLYTIKKTQEGSIE